MVKITSTTDGRFLGRTIPHPCGRGVVQIDDFRFFVLGCTVDRIIGYNYIIQFEDIGVAHGSSGMAGEGTDHD